MNTPGLFRSFILSLTGAAILFAGNSTAEADHLIYDDLIVTGSECIGFDCQNGESFGFDTLILKEHNLRIFFNDTSYTASYPRNDWRLIINSRDNGGGNFFSVQDATANKRIFTLEAKAPAHSLYVDNYGRVGFGTSAPVVELHVKDSDSPTLRLHQDSSGGWTSQTWDVTGNESNFFIRDATNGSKLPFRIQPGAPSSSIAIRASGNVGLGTWSPAAALEVERTNGTAKILVEELNGTAAGRIMLELANRGQPWIAFKNSATGDEFRFGMNANGDFLVSAPGTGGQELNLSTQGELQIRSGGDLIFDLDSNGNLAIDGVISTGSSRTFKENFKEVDLEGTLAKIEKLQVLDWNYKKDDSSVRHVSPLAEEFYAAFRLGGDEKHLAPSDMAGVNLAAIKALKQLVDQKDRQIAELSARVRELEKKQADNAGLQVRIQRLEQLIAPQLQRAALEEVPTAH